jgi:class 3 adenylate cyclase/predicted ATPase
MFCNLVHATALAERVDPEELHQIIGPYQQACTAQIAHFQGHVAQHLGDGLLVYFGYPLAHEDDPQRAVLAGLGILAELKRLNARLRRRVAAIREQPLQARIGIHTGLAIVGEPEGATRPGQLAVGDTINVAARLPALAAPDTLLVSDTTYALTSGYFSFEALGPQQLKGLSQPLGVYRVLGLGQAQDRFAVAVQSGLTPLVGRDAEAALLQGRWAAARERNGQVILLGGESGIGKSRLVQALQEAVVGEACICLHGRCSPFHQNTALYPVTGLLEQAFGFDREDAAQARWDKLLRALELQPLAPEALPLLASLLSLPMASRAMRAPRLSPQQTKERTRQAVLQWLSARSQTIPLLIVVEDLHWADASTLEFLGLLMDLIPTARVLLILSFRPEFTPPWAARSHLTPLVLGRLPTAMAEAMVVDIAGDKRLPPEVLREITSKADGVPLFVEELTKMVLESGLIHQVDNRYELTGPLPPLAVPATLHDSLMARLDRLATVKEVAQIGATLGREFSFDLLSAVSGLPEAGLRQALAKLVEAEVLYPHGLVPQAHYLFKHALIQDAAYQSLLKSTRQRYHQRAAQVLEQRFATTGETQPELLAHHYTEAGLVTQAIPYWQRAGDQAIARSANAEAVAHLSKAQELLSTLPETPETTRQELAVCLALGIPLMALKGPASPEVGILLDRARELCQIAGDDPERFRVLRGLARFYLIRGEHRTARELGEQLLAHGQATGDPALLLGGHYATGCPLFYMGRFELAHRHLAAGIALYDIEQHRADGLLHGALDAGVGCLCFDALTLWFLGYADQALERAKASLQLAEELAHPYTDAATRAFVAWVHMLRGEAQATRHHAEAAMALSQEHGLGLYLALSSQLHGWALTYCDQTDEGITRLRRGIDAYLATGGGAGGPAQLAALAESYCVRGQAADALTLLTQAFALVEKQGEHMFEAELHRLRGEALLRLVSDTPVEAELCFKRALETARRQGAQALALRAALSLGRLQRCQGNSTKACSELRTVRTDFTEGFDTSDWREATSLLEDLEHATGRNGG